MVPLGGHGGSDEAVVIVMVAAAFSVLGLVASGAGATTAAPRAAVLAVSATPGALGHAGGLAQVKGRVEHAKSCQLELLASQSLTVGYSHNPKPCSGQGAGYSAHIVVGANPSRQSRVVSFALVARNATSSSTKRFSVAVAPRPPLRPKATTTPTTTTPTKTTPTTLAATTTVRRTTTTALPKTAATTAATTTNVFPGTSPWCKTASPYPHRHRSPITVSRLPTQEQMPLRPAPLLEPGPR
jgi:hypothetical protein